MTRKRMLTSHDELASLKADAVIVAVLNECGEKIHVQPGGGRLYEL